MAPRLPVFSKIAEEDVSDAPKGKWKEGIVTPVNDLMSSQKALMNKGVTFEQNIQCEKKSFDIVVPDCWKLLTPINSWTTNGVPLRVCKHPDGSVEMQGDLTGGVSNTVLAAGTIPAQYRPQYNMRFCSARAAYATFTVGSDGSLTQTTGTDGAFNCRYEALDATPIANSKFPITIATQYSKKPGQVLVSQVEDLNGTDPKPIGCVMTLDWSYGQTNGSPCVIIKNLCGLPYNRKYRVNLLIIGE